MPLLDACLAFALTMLSLATLATLATEMFVRLMGTRANGIRLMLDDLFQQEVVPVLKAAGKAEAIKLKEATESLLKSPLADLPANTFWNKVMKVTAKWLGLTKLTSLDFDELLKRLPETELGKEVAALAVEKRVELFDRLAHRYDEFGKAVTDLFARYSQLFSLIAGMGIALVMNVDSFRLFQEFQEDASLRGRVTASADQVVAAWESAQAQVDERVNDGGAPAAALTKEQLDERKAEFENLWQEVNALDLPIGYKYFQQMPPSSGTDSPLLATIAWLWFYGGWLVRVLISGLLIGLGGPFWYNVATKLMAVTRTIRGGASGNVQLPAGDTASQDSTSVLPVARDVSAATTSNPAHDLFMKFAKQENRN